MQALVGHRFPGGTFTIEHWENVLLADATGSAPLPDGLVHPAWLFHGPSPPSAPACGELFALFRADSDEAIRGGGYEWTIHTPLREGVPYRDLGRGDRGRAQAEPQPRGDGRDTLPDRDRDRRRRAGGLDRLDLARPEGRRVTVEPGAPIPPWHLAAVDPEKMKLYAALARDPNPIHWDRSEVAARGLGDRLINQGPLSLGYVVNMLLAWAGPASLRDLAVRFTAPVLDGDAVTAGGVVTAVRSDDDGRLADCEVWLTAADGTRAVEGTATVALAAG